jgi:photosystem II stability/assembly factor-like uncharacterized protein
MRPLRSVLASVIILVLLRAVPAYSWHGTGNITALAIDPKTPTTLYAVTSDRGVFKSTDGGATWGASGLTNVYVGALAIDPQTPSIIYAGTEGGGVFKSSDGGQSWLAINTGLTGVADLVIDPQTPTILYSLIPNTGVLKSTDGGANWTGLLAGNVCVDEIPILFSSSSVGPLAIDSRTPTTLYAAVYCQTWEGQEWSEVHKSTDGGANWFTTGLDFNWWVWTGVWFQSIYVLAIDPQTPTAHVYAAGYDYVQHSLLRSTDGGTSWSTLITDQTSAFFPLAIAPRTDPEAPSTLYRGSYDRGVLKSTDGGVTWSAVNAGLTETLQAYGVKLIVLDLVIDTLNPTTLYLGTGIGVFKSTDGGGYWSPTGLIQHSPLTSVSLNPTSVTAGTTSTGTVTLITAAPAGGITVTLSSSNTAVASVPASVTVAAGATSANFTVSTSSVSDSSGVEIYAVFDGATRYAQLTVTALSSVNLSPPSVTGGTTATGRVNLSAAAPAGGAVVELSSSNPAVATIPATVTVPAGDTGAYFTVSTSAVAASTAVTISGAYGGVTRSAVLTVVPTLTLSSVSLDPTSVTGGTTSTGMVTLNAAAPAGGATVTLSSSNTAVASVPASVTVAAGGMRQLFRVSTSAVAASTSVTISGAYGGITRSAVLTVTPPPVSLSSLSLNPASVTGGNASTGTVTLSTAASGVGAMVTLSSSDPVVAAAPTSVTVAAGATSANFAIFTATCTSGSVTISGAYGGVTRSADLTVTLGTTDTVGIQQADYFVNKRELRVAAKSTSSTATLQVFVTSSGELIGTMRHLGDGKYSGQFTWPVNPQNITVRSSLCGSATSAVRSK